MLAFFSNLLFITKWRCRLLQGWIVVLLYFSLTCSCVCQGPSFESGFVSQCFAPWLFEMTLSKLSAGNDELYEAKQSSSMSFNKLLPFPMPIGNLRKIPILFLCSTLSFGGERRVPSKVKSGNSNSASAFKVIVPSLPPPLNSSTPNFKTLLQKRSLVRVELSSLLINNYFSTLKDDYIMYRRMNDGGRHYLRKSLLSLPRMHNYACFFLI